MRASVAALALVLAGCSVLAETAAERDPQNAFWDALSSHCGNAYAGEIVSEDERDADWRGRDMIAHWAQCDERVIAIAFHMEDPESEDGWDRSRTWVVGRTDTFSKATTVGTAPPFVTEKHTHTRGLHLSHDHRHADGEEDAVTRYGGNAVKGSPQFESSATAQDFPVDTRSKALFKEQGLDASLTNVWRLEVTAAGSEDPHFVYQLTRRNDPTRLFRVRFDASTPVEPPPPAWGRK